MIDNVVPVEWLLASTEKREPLPTNEYIVSNEMVSAEALRIAKSSRQVGKGFLDGFSIYTTEAATKTMVMPATDYNLLLCATGATIMDSLSSVTDSSFNNLIVIDVAVPRAKKLKSETTAMVEAARVGGALIKDPNWLFGAIMAQDVEYDSSLQSDEGRRKERRKDGHDSGSVLNVASDIVLKQQQSKSLSADTVDFNTLDESKHGVEDIPATPRCREEMNLRQRRVNPVVMTNSNWMEKLWPSPRKWQC